MADLIERDALMKEICGNECGSVCDEECEKVMCNYYDYIMDAPAVNRWIPCSERLPEDQTRVLIKTIYGGMCIAKRCGNGDWYTDGSGTYHAHEVTRWMPLPEEGEDDA